MPRSPELMSAADTALLVVDLQERLMPAINDAGTVVWNVGRLVDAAKILGVPVAATEQYPAGLGPTVTEVAARVGEASSKLDFSCAGCPGVFARLAESGRRRILLCGVEAHVCVQQTAYDLLAANWRVYVAVDAVGSRREVDYRTALRRMETAGVVLTTTEAAVFEWCERAGTPEFKEISRLVRQSPPG